MSGVIFTLRYNSKESGVTLLISTCNIVKKYIISKCYENSQQQQNQKQQKTKKPKNAGLSYITR